LSFSQHRDLLEIIKTNIQRYSLVFFSISQFGSVPHDQRHALPDYPKEQQMNDLMRMLAPPRGYSAGKLQQSIFAAFGMPERQQALRWPSTNWSRLPADVVVRLRAFNAVVGTLSKHFRRRAV
jgi:hypothetical protein